MLTNQRHYDSKLSDVWSSGVMLFAMMFCRYPFERSEDEGHRRRNQLVMQRACAGEHTAAFAGTVSLTRLVLFAIMNCGYLFERSVNEGTMERAGHAASLRRRGCASLRLCGKLLLQPALLVQRCPPARSCCYTRKAAAQLAPRCSVQLVTSLQMTKAAPASLYLAAHSKCPKSARSESRDRQEPVMAENLHSAFTTS